MFKISVCIPTMNRWFFLQQNIPKYLNNPFIDEIVITDENGNDASKLKEHFPNQPKLKVIVNEKRLGCFKNKIKSVLSASNDCVALIDSDNFADINYFEKFIKYIENKPYNNLHIYSPDDSIPDFSFKKFSGWEITRQNVLDFFERDNSSHVLINQGNYILSKTLVQKINFLNYEREITSLGSSADVMLTNYIFFNEIPEFRIHIVPGMSYYHVVHDDSIVLLNKNHMDSVRELFRMYYKLHNRRPPFDLKKKTNNNSIKINKNTLTMAAGLFFILFALKRKN